MSGKKVAIGKRPLSTSNVSADAWVESYGATPKTEPEPIAEKKENSEEMKRLTIDIPASLHRAIKSQTGARGAKIADEVRELLMQKYGNTEIIK